MLDMSKLQKQKEKLTQELTRSSGQSARFWKPEDGTNVIRVMPAWTDQEPYKGQFWREVSQHWNLSADQKGPVICPEPDVSCPVCKFVAELREDKNDVKAQELAKELRAKKAFFINIVDVNDSVYNVRDVAEYKKSRPDQDVPFEAGDPKIQVYACPKTVFDQILDCIMQNDSDITDLEKGHDLTLGKSGKGLTTRYTLTPKMKSSASDVSKGQDLPQLDRVGFSMSSEELSKMLAEGAGGDFVAALPSGKKAASLPKDTSSKGGAADDIEAEMSKALAG